MEIRDANPASARTIKASEFKAKRLKLMDEVADSGVGIVITRNAHPISRLVPCRETPKCLLGIDRGKLEILGNIDEPPGVVREAETGKIQEEGA